ncbi:MAG: tRNA (guanine(10)-N(2))-dimethyltransferase, partial [Thermoplasmata archaeon]
MTEIKLVREGKTEFFVPSSLELKKEGPGKKGKFGFYNPAMAESRDISVAVVRAMLNESTKELKVLDGLSSVGARGLRIANESDGEFKVILNDWNERA